MKLLNQQKNQQINKQQGLAWLPLVSLLLISQLVILQGSKQLATSLTLHQLKLHQDCQQVAKTINSSQALAACPPCPLPALCND